MPRIRIKEIIAFTIIDDDDEEGIIAMLHGDIWMPLIASDRVRFDQLRPIAEDIARQKGKPLNILKFKLIERVIDGTNPPISDRNGLD